MKKIISFALSLLIVFSSMSCITVSVSAEDACTHTYGDWVTDVAATCTSEGYKHRECTLCGNVENSVISKSSHNVSSWTVTTAATCVDKGSKYGTCSVCLQTIESTISALGHTYIETTYPELSDGVTSGPLFSSTCSRCGYVLDEKVTSYIPVYTAQDLRNIDADLYGSYLLMNDIDLSSEEYTDNYGELGFGWRPIGASSNLETYGRFEGVFNGNGHTISGLKINIDSTYYLSSTASLGLFSRVAEDAIVVNLSLSDIDIKYAPNSCEEVYIGGISAYVDGLIDCCSVTGSIDVSSYITNLYVGGICGYNAGEVEMANCSNHADITCQTTSDEIYVGGVAGEIDNASSTIQSCSNTGDITVKSYGATSYVGGVVGSMAYTTSIFIVKGSKAYNLYNSGNILGVSGTYTSGLIGRHYYKMTAPKIYTSYNVGNVRYSTSENDTEIKLGNALSSKNVEQSYYLNGVGTGNGRTLSEEEMKTQAGFSGFDFSEYWTFDESVSEYPVLKNSFCMKFGHTSSDWKELTPSSCIQNGVSVKLCVSCNKIFEEKTTGGNGEHTLGVYVFQTIPDLYNSGYATRTCMYCNYNESYVIEPVIEEGVCGDGLHWLYTPSGFLQIYGYGKMYNWTDETEVPWYKYSDGIKYVYLDEAIKSIGNYAFYSCKNIEIFNTPTTNDLLTFPTDLECIEANAFSTCIAFPEIDNTQAIIANYTSFYENSVAKHKKIFELTNGEYFETRNESEECLYYFGGWITTKEATCTESGSQYRQCSKCGYREYKTISKFNHNIPTWTITKQPTCSAYGEKSGVCTICSTTLTSSISKLDHTVSTWTTTVEPTCTSTGQKSGTCTVCSATVTASVNKASHSVSSWTTDTSATCTSKGQRHGTCSNCSTVVYEKVESLGHSYNVTEYPAIPDGETIGAIHRRCSRCNYIDKVNSAIQFIPVYTVDDLRAIENNLSGNYLLMNDIDLSTVSGDDPVHGFGNGWRPIAANRELGFGGEFSGVLNGNGHTIKGLKINVNSLINTGASEISLGLFSRLNSGAQICNLCLSDIDINYSKLENPTVYIGGIAGYGDGETNYCSVSGSIKVDTNNKTSNVGGLFGYHQGKTVINYCSNDTDIYCNTETSNMSVGGVVGFIDYNSGSIESCSNTGDITVKAFRSASYVGGVVGSMGANGSKMSLFKASKAYNLFNTGVIKGSSDTYTSGLIGRHYQYISAPKVYTSYNFGNVIVLDEYNSDNLNERGNAISSKNVEDCYFLQNTGSGKGIAVSENEMKLQSTYVDFDFSNYWCFDTNESLYPFLKNSFCKKFGHLESEWRIITKPNCLQNGVEAKVCLACGKNIKQNNIQQNGEHSFGVLYFESEPTTESSGSAYRVCEYCNYVEYITVLPIIANGKCGNDLYWRYSESGILDVYGSGSMYSWSDETQVPWYEFAENITTVYLAEGVTSIGSYAFYNCPNIELFNTPGIGDLVALPLALELIEANAFKTCLAFPNIDNTLPIPAKYLTIFENNIQKHSKTFELSYGKFFETRNEKELCEDYYSDWIITKAPSCVASGSQFKECKKCGSRVTETLSRFDHNITTWTITQQPTCTANGEKSGVCTLCSNTVTATLTKLDHTVDSWTTTTTATCTSTGQKTGVCTVCSENVTQTVAKSNHSVSSWTTDVAATCTETGSRHGTCSNCSTTVYETVSAKGHSYSEFVFSVIPEGETLGSRTRSCSSCNVVDSHNIEYTPIYTVSDLRNINNNLSGSYLLMNDIDLSGYPNPTPIGVKLENDSYVISAFTGILNGNGHTIKGLQLSYDNSINVFTSSYNLALIGLSNGTITGLSVEDVEISYIDNDPNNTQFENVFVGGIVAENNGIIEYCNVNGKITVDGNDGEQICVGGIAGFNEEEIKYSSSNTNIDVNSDTKSVNVGGIVGYSKASKGKINSCSNFGDVCALGIVNEICVGGIVGYASGENTILDPGPQNLINAGNIKGSGGSFVSGIVGKLVKNIFNLSNVYRSYNVGSVKYTLDDGKTWLIGNAISNLRCKSCYYLQGTGDGVGVSLYEEEMKNASSFEGFSFNDYWKLTDYKYPTLRKTFCEKYGHKDGVWVVEVEATCGSDGKEVMLCPTCGLVKESRAIESNGEHKLGSLTVTIAPTKDTPGEGYRECKDCGIAVYEPISVADDSGSCGDNLTWAFSDNVLYIYGNGEMDSWSEPSMVPWYSIKDSIERIVVYKDVTSIGNYAFNGCVNAENVELPQALVKIGAESLSDCSAFPNISNPTTVFASYESNNNKTHTKVFKLTQNSKDFIYVYDVCSFTANVIEPTYEKPGCTKNICTYCGYCYETDFVSPLLGDKTTFVKDGQNSIVLFNSGLKTETGKHYGNVFNSKNPAWDTIDNQNYDIYGGMSFNNDDVIRIGLGFYVSNTVVENVILSVNAFDVDEEGGEYDKVILVDETTGERKFVGTLSGMNQQWNNTKISISPNYFTKGHVYHFEVEITDIRGGASWVVYVRNVSIQITTKGENVENTFINAGLTASIDENGIVTPSLTLATSRAMNLIIEYDAVCANYQYGSYFASISSSQNTTEYVSKFNLSENSPEGVYSITAYIKDTDGNVLKTLTANAGYSYYAVSYDSNGGSNTIPVDNIPYSLGKTVTVLFNSIPARDGYTFLGWSEDKDATVPTYTVTGKKTFVIRDNDVVLYAVWADNVCQEHKFSVTVLEQATCIKDGTISQTCDICGYSETITVSAHHNYSETNRVEATCTTEGFIEYTCSICGDVYTETLTASHKFEVEITKVPKHGENGIITYTCVICGYTYTEEIIGDGSHILLVQDTVPWEIDNNPKLLNKLVQEGYIDGWTLTSTDNFMNVDLSEYEVILIANDQTTSTYNKLASFNNKLCEYAENGGTIVYGACDDGWENGTMSHSLPGGVVKKSYLSNNNYIVDYSSHIVKGDLTDNLQLTNRKLKGTFCSHTYFDKYTLPESSNIILVDANSNPTLVEYELGDGRVVASGLTWEFYFTRVYNSIDPNFSKSVYDDLLVFALSNGWCIECKHATQTEVKLAKCTENGYIRDICSECGVIISEEILPALGHDSNGDYRVIKKATCEEDGLKGLYCARCDILIADNIVISASGHEFSEWTIDTEATCYNDGVRTRHCIHNVNTDEYEACSAVENEKVLKLTHNYGDVIITSPALCIDDGIGYRQCSLCGDTQNEVIPAIGHNYSTDWVIIENANCTQDGSKAHVCLNCNLALDITVIKANGHNFDAWDFSVVPTCTEDGERFTQCNICNEEKTETVSALGHKYSNEWTIDVAVSCLTDGEKSHHCLNCDDRIDITIVVSTGHKFSQWISDVSVSCITDGESHRTCSQCSEEEYLVVPAYGHNYSNAWTYDTAPTCTENGVKSHHCNHCDSKIDLTVVSAYGHIFDEWTIVKEATEDENGIQERQCLFCSYIESEEFEYIDKTHLISGAVSYIVVDKYGNNNLFVGGSITADISNVTAFDGGEFECVYQWNVDGEPIEGATNDTYVATKDDLGKNITVTVTAIGEYSGSVTGGKKYVYLDKVENVVATNVNTGVKISWDKHDYADEYQIYRLSTSSGVAVCKATTVDLEYIDTTATNYDETYTYYVVAVNRSCESDKSDFAEIKRLNVLELHGELLNDGGIELDWSQVSGETTINPIYHVLGKTENGEWTEIGYQNAPFVYYNNGEDFEYFAVYFEEEGYRSQLSNIVNLYGLNTPVVSTVLGTCYITVSWNSIPKAFSYTIKRNGKTITTVEDLTEYHDYEIDTGVEYTYEVCANNDKASSAFGSSTVVADLLHSFGKPIVEKIATCTEGGIETIICDTCGYENTYETVAKGHNFSDVWVIDKTPTCVQNGSKSQHCSICGEKNNVTTIAATGHTYGDLEYITKPSCTEEGLVRLSCIECNYERQMISPALGHTYSVEWYIDKMPTCTEPGSTSHKCISCDSVTDVTEILPLGHDYPAEFTVDIKPTCTEAGEKSQHCKNCDERTNVSVIDPLGHNFDTRWTIDIEATCLEDGEKSHHCLVCHVGTDVTVIPATGHSNSDWIIATEATCFENGLKYQECENCKVKTYEEIPIGNHIYGGWTVVENATCDTEGLKTRVCSLCEATDSQTVVALGHYYSNNWTIDKQATCTEDGSMSHHCIRCSDKKDDTVLPATDHCFGGWFVEIEATCENAGSLARECEVCSIREYQDTEATGHSYSPSWTIDVAPTCTQTGVKSKHCLNCDAIKDATRVSATGHLYSPWVFDIEATCDTEGSRHKVCENCGDTVNQSILALGHHYSTMWTIDVESTCLTKGEKSHHCLRCDDKTDIEEIPYGGHIFGKWYVVTEPTMDTDGIREHKCYNCDFTEDLVIPKLHKYIVTFVADGDIVATVDFPEDATEIVVPEVPHKDKYTGEWENFEIRNKNFTVDAIYTPILTDNMDGIDASNQTDYFESTGEIEVNLHASAKEKTIVTTTTKPVPLDIIFVLDQSGSMADGNKTEALKNAVTTFSDSILADAIAKNVEHRIALVGFASGSNNNLNYGNTELLTSEVVKYNLITDNDLKDSLVLVNNNGKINSIITKAIKQIDANGATKADLGLEMASNIFANNPVSGNRQRVVVFLTDGEPTSFNGFEYGVANAAIQNAYQIKNTYDSRIYSVGIFDNATANNRAVNNFMNYVSSNYKEEIVMKKTSKETTPAASGYYLNVSDVSKLSEVFTSIVEETIIHTGEFDNVTLKYTLSKNFTLTSVQEENLRKNAIEELGVKNEQIVITRNDDGTTTIIIESVKPWLSDGKYIVDFTFRASANENTLKSGTYQTNTYESGLVLEEGEGYEVVFVPTTVDVKGTSGIVTFNINKVPYFIERLTSTMSVLAPDVDFGLDHDFSGWNIPSNLTLNNSCRTFEASLDRNEYIVSWNINGEIIEQSYEVGSIITPPEVKGDSIGGMFAGWDKQIPETMPSENLTFNAIYEAHYHTYSVTKEFDNCSEGGMLTYLCECGDTYTETIEASNHAWEAITGATADNEQHSVGFRCSVCGVQNNNDLELERVDTYQEPNSEYNTATYEFNYVDENGENMQPDGDVEISVQLDEVFETDVPEDATANVYRVNDDGSRTLLESEQDGMNMTFTTDHFSTYEFEFTTGEQKYLFAENGAKIDYTKKLIFSSAYATNDIKSIATYLVPGMITDVKINSSYFATGSTFDFSKGGVTDNYKIIINGDLNGDGVCNVLDAMYAERVSSGHVEATEDEIYAANGCVSDELDVSSYQNVVNMALAS